MEKRILSNAEVNNIYKAIGHDFGFCEDIKETFCAWCYNWKSDAYTWSADAAFYMLYDCVNYDLVCITQRGAINVENSNNQALARKMKALCDKNTIEAVYVRIF